MAEIKVKIRITDPRGSVPGPAARSAAGADLRAILDDEVAISPGKTVLFHTGIAVEIPEGYAGLIYARSGLASRLGLAPANKVGLIASDYRGEILVPLYNQSSEEARISPGDRIAQLVIMPVMSPEFILSDELGETPRGAGGFGSTGR
jgi:dUTP pyrophosphatase